jgi:hypothetical protein
MLLLGYLKESFGWHGFVNDQKHDSLRGTF